MNVKKRKLARTAVLGGVLVGLVAWAESNPLVMSASVVDGTLSIATTQKMDKGWFSTKNTLDRTKTDLRVTYTVGATACSAIATGTLSSTTVGEFTPLLNIGENNVIGYFWNTAVDVAAYAEHYTIHIHCDGTQHIHGCNVARPVSVLVQAFDKNGVPRTYLDDSGATQPVEVILDAGSIAPVLDATVTETNCEDSCGIGPCVSECEHACPGKGAKACKDACQCECKIKKHTEIPLCHPNAPDVCED